jgi:hypothetical protein
VTQAEMEAEITNLRAQLSRIEQEQNTRREHWLRLEKVSRGMAVAFGLTAVILIIAGAIFLARSNPIFPFALSLILTTLALGLLAQTLRDPPHVV